jgi:hypothetical protein
MMIPKFLIQVLRSRHILTLFTIFSIIGFQAYAQQVSIQLGPDEIALNEPFTITITSENDQLRTYGQFPDIPGFSKRGTSSSSSTNIINGRVSSRQSIIQNYVANAEGTYQLEPFTMEINGKEVQSPGKTIRVGPPAQQRNRVDPFSTDPFEDFFGRPDRSDEFVDIKEDAFLALTTSKIQVYVGEGFTMTLAFYVAEENRAPLQFYEPAKQLSDILKELKPSNCWEENYNIDNLNAESVVINGKRYSQYKIYQATYYPLNLDPISFPQVPFKMIKYKVAKNPSFFGRNRQEDFKTYYTKPQKVFVRDLPPHPLKDQVSVGNYKLKEEISDNHLETGRSFNYSFTVYGEGNISAVTRPEPVSDHIFEIYPPNIRQNINRGSNRVTGNKSFNYYIIPNEPGEYRLSDYFNWVYFNPIANVYDTLTSEMTVQVTGESKRNDQIQSNDLGTFYDQIEIENNRLSNLHRDQWVKTFANLFILVMLGASIYFVIKK